jgi:hypothetical protein
MQKRSAVPTRAARQTPDAWTAPSLQAVPGLRSHPLLRRLPPHRRRRASRRQKCQNRCGELRLLAQGENKNNGSTFAFDRGGRRAATCDMAPKSSSLRAANTMPMHGLVVWSRFSGPLRKRLAVDFVRSCTASDRSRLQVRGDHHFAMRMIISPVHAKRVIHVRTYERRWAISFRRGRRPSGWLRKSSPWLAHNLYELGL